MIQMRFVLRARVSSTRCLMVSLLVILYFLHPSHQAVISSDLIKSHDHPVSSSSLKPGHVATPTTYHNHLTSSLHPSHPHPHSHSHHHSHLHSHEPAKLRLNETAILLSHQPSPLSYLSYDRHLVVVDPSTGALAPNPEVTKTYPGWLVAHAIGMSLAWFVALPLALVTSTSQNIRPNIIFRLAFILTLILSLVSGAVYRSSTPKLYEGEKHSAHGWVLVWLGLAFSASDLVRMWCKHKDLLNQQKMFGYHAVPIGDGNSGHSSESSTLSPTSSGLSHQIMKGDTSSWRGKIISLSKSVGERLLVILASVAAIHGAVIYTGTCRAEYVNGCLAHFIKGGIFFWYGILNWIRYLGAFPELGWPWHHVENKIPGSPSAEMFESAVVFLYGATNVWMERFGSEPGEPYTVKQIQHISIAAMFAFGGLVGVLLETRPVRSLLFGPQETQTSNPFPTLCITITGLAMSAHHQEYQFQVSIHTLWGVLLGLFGVMRWMTYALASQSRGPPVTEALGSLFLISGGTVFMESVEEITFSAMRHGFDDMMAFLNVTIAFVCFIMAWTMILMTIKRKTSN